jgi:hypothetical protein
MRRLAAGERRSERLVSGKLESVMKVCEWAAADRQIAEPQTSRSCQSQTFTLAILYDLNWSTAAETLNAASCDLAAIITWVA